ncbi:hypothetical protein CGX12_12805 [Zobellella denitrificans]|jgi:anion-transporting  ArsA/GET3 family ATPase|uniref:Uncharacterized protein n=1 Tax=Zobellella denitrificans TaxID=347534 RepID=A0A231MXK1_9GAMM|nr:hypothetical protein [Zobellella denitrificans]ATG73036.1 hypothetical protein AN401_03500 [Zobellella denitrificans]OXS14715.1 hypothetical protein CGX12_12805 [Zobellella denitrificans]
MHDSVTAKLHDTLKELYHQAIDADKKLAGLRAKGQAKFSAVLREDSQFTTHADHFMPYVAELAEELELLEMSTDEEYQALLGRMVHKIQLLASTLGQFLRLS